MVIPPKSLWNYFNITRVDNATVRSDPPYVGTVWVPDRVYGGLPISQAINGFVSLHPNCVPHTLNYKFMGPANINVPFVYKIKNYEDGNIASIYI
ncbi:hypothetical protein PMAYCL1PPCAC_16624, partial [Pristionchus mayeri]